MCGTYSITCPGVWLCKNGALEATIKTLGYFFKTGEMEPKFPVLCHDQFVMEGYFKSVDCVSELEQALGAEGVEITLWQNGRRLAYFVGQLADVMHPPMPKLSCFHNVNVQILMHPTQAFPGIIAPKLEISARATASEKMCTKNTCSVMSSSCPSVPVSSLPKDIGEPSSHRHDDSLKSYEHRRQRPVCHAKIFRTEEVKAPTGNTYSLGTSKPVNHCLRSKNSMISLNDSTLQSRRISSCSSSSTIQSCTFMSGSTLSKCSHLFSYPSDTEDHQQHCAICLSYKKAFNPSISNL